MGDMGQKEGMGSDGACIRAPSADPPALPSGAPVAGLDRPRECRVVSQV